MIILEHEQQSPEWHAARCGCPSASNFDLIVTTKGETSKQREKYLYRLAGERITGKAEETYQNAAMQRGTELEGEARSFYQLVNDVEVKQVGFCLADGNFRYGCSPDGLIGENGIIEIKCPLIATHVGYLLKGELPIDYFQQVQGGLLVTGREWTDFISYYCGMDPLIVRVERDDAFIDKLKGHLEDFCIELDKIVKTLKKER